MSASVLNSNGSDADPGGSYQRVSSSTDAEEPIENSHNNNNNNSNSNNSNSNSDAARRSLRNFLLMAVLFSANHGCVVSCLALASSRLGTVGAWQSGILYIVYSASSLLGATYIVKTMGARNAMAVGMASYCVYVGCFYAATKLQETSSESWSSSSSSSSSSGAATFAAYLGAVLGGVGAGFLWTAQGTYFGLASQDRAGLLGTPVEESNAKLAGYFAFLYLAEELLMRLLSSVLAAAGVSWESIFGVYTLIAVGSTLAMPCVHNYPKTEDDDNDDNDENENNSAFRKATVAAKLLIEDPKMKHMIGLNAVFGFTSAFLNSYVNGQVLPVALDDPDSRYVGVLTSTVAIVAAGMSLVFGSLGGSKKTQARSVNEQDNNNNNNDTTTTTTSNNSKTNDYNGLILIIGALCFGGVVLPFVVQPDASHYGWKSLFVVYCLHGTGRATFEGTLRSTFADYFSYEKEGAFANIILQNGIASGIGYILTFALTCENPSKYCIEYRNGSLHDVWTFEFIALASVGLAIGGYLRASNLHRNEQQQQQQRMVSDVIT